MTKADDLEQAKTDRYAAFDHEQCEAERCARDNIIAAALQAVIDRDYDKAQRLLERLLG